MLPFRIALASLSALLLVSLAQAQNAPAAPDWTSAQTVQLGMANFAFTPATLEFRANTPTRFRLTNSASNGHSFAAPEFLNAVAVAPQDRAKVAHGEIEVEAGQTVEVMFVPMRSGSYKFHCSHFMHTSLGMSGTVVVK